MKPTNLLLCQAVQNSLDDLAELQEHDSSLAPIVSMLSEAALQNWGSR